MYRTLAIYQNYTHRIIAACAAALALSVLLYGTFLLIAVHKTASRAAIQSEIDALHARIASLESQYLQGQGTITPLRAQELGFVMPSRVHTVYTEAAERLTLVR